MNTRVVRAPKVSLGVACVFNRRSTDIDLQLQNCGEDQDLK